MCDSAGLQHCSCQVLPVVSPVEHPMRVEIEHGLLLRTALKSAPGSESKWLKASRDVNRHYLPGTTFMLE